MALLRHALAVICATTHRRPLALSIICFDQAMSVSRELPVPGRTIPSWAMDFEEEKSIRCMVNERVKCELTGDIQQLQIENISYGAKTAEDSRRSWEAI